MSLYQNVAKSTAKRPNPNGGDPFAEVNGSFPPTGAMAWNLRSPSRRRARAVASPEPSRTRACSPSSSPARWSKPPKNRNKMMLMQWIWVNLLKRTNLVHSRRKGAMLST